MRVCLQIREAQLSQYNYILVVGEKEREAETVNVRTREAKQPFGEHKLSDVLDLLSKERESRSLNSSFGGSSANGLDQVV